MKRPTIKFAAAGLILLVLCLLPLTSSVRGVGGARPGVVASSGIFLTGADAGAPGGHVKVFSAVDGSELSSFLAYPGFAGGVRVAVGDITGDGIPDIITGAGAGSPGGHVKVFSGINGSEVRSFFAYPGVDGGVFVASGDINGDGRDDIITGIGATAPHVKVFSGTDGLEIRSFLAYAGFVGGVYVAAGDVDGDGRDDIITGIGAGGPDGHVKVFSGTDGSQIRSFFAYPGFAGGVLVAGGDITGDCKDDIITGAATTAPHVKVFSGADGAEIRSFFAYPGFVGGVRVGSVDRNGDGRDDIITSVGPGAPGGHVKVFSGVDNSELESFFPYPGFAGGAFVGGSRTKIDATTTITSDSPDPSAIGQTVTFTYKVTNTAPGPCTPTGNVIVSDGVDSCTGTVAAGTCDLALTTAGPRTLTATYVGDSNFNGSTDTELHFVGSVPTITKAFGSSAIALNGTTSLTFTINNGNAVPLSGVAFSDILPGGLVVATPNGLNSSCGGTVTAAAGSGSISLVDGTVAANSSCNISVNVTGTTPGKKDNTTGPIASTETGPGATSNTESVTVFPLAGSISDPFECTGPGDVLVVTFETTNAALVAQSVTATANIPAGLLALPGTCATNVGTCAVVDASTVTLSADLAPGQTVTLTYQVQVSNVLTSGTTVCIDTTASFGGGPPLNVEACATINCPEVGPGLPFLSASDVSDQKAGSVLVYNLHTSNPSMPNVQNTRITVTNTNPTLSSFVHLFFIDGATCSIANSFICLTANQTLTFLTSDLDPGTTGYIVAVAVDSLGCPVNFNYLIGDAYVKFATGHAANLGAEAISALAGGLPLCDGSTQTALLSFDDISYGALPRVLAADGIPARGTGNDTILVVNRLGGNLLQGASAIGPIFGILYNDQEESHSFTFTTGNCQYVSSLSNSFPVTVPRFETVISGDASGWLKFWGTNDIAILGAKITVNPNVGLSEQSYNQGRNLHKLKLTRAAQITIPILSPGC